VRLNKSCSIEDLQRARNFSTRGHELGKGNLSICGQPEDFSLDGLNHTRLELQTGVRHALVSL